MFSGITLGAFLDIVRLLSLKQAIAIPAITVPVQFLATHLGVDWKGGLVGAVGVETSLASSTFPQDGLEVLAR